MATSRTVVASEALSEESVLAVCFFWLELGPRIASESRAAASSASASSAEAAGDSDVCGGAAFFFFGVAGFGIRKKEAKDLRKEGVRPAKTSGP